ncbi:hypothetical protein BT63DRAFT_449960 [Microthyrium microscopicum]|uniref:Uncharacterized protein n=1 Tax=Microthyrium microscopicum TaxID=703497 RepID=A0A6A6UU19_9PEZI|nr:hypothetical protein BT63DRAFT_449960 [Microthyrium microscopicum]
MSTQMLVFVALITLFFSITFGTYYLKAIMNTIISFAARGFYFICAMASTAKMLFSLGVRSYKDPKWAIVGAIKAFVTFILSMVARILRVAIGYIVGAFNFLWRSFVSAHTSTPIPPSQLHIPKMDRTKVNAECAKPAPTNMPEFPAKAEPTTLPKLATLPKPTVYRRMPAKFEYFERLRQPSHPGTHYHKPERKQITPVPRD